MTVSPAPHRPRLVALALLAAFGTAGCGTGSDADPGGDASGSAAAESSSPEPSSPEPEAPTAADGTDYAACDDGSCEVAVSSEPVSFAFDEFTLTVNATEDGIETRKEGDGGTGTGSMSGGYCLSYVTVDGTSTSCYGAVEDGAVPEPPEPEPGVLALELLDVTDGTAIIRLTMG